MSGTAAGGGLILEGRVGDMPMVSLKLRVQDSFQSHVKSSYLAPRNTSNYAISNHPSEDEVRSQNHKAHRGHRVCWLMGALTCIAGQLVHVRIHVTVDMICFSTKKGKRVYK